MHNRLLAFGLMAPLTLASTGFIDVRAQANDMFPTKAAAEQRAKELKCSGAFAMGSEWMPCKTFADYEEAIKKAS
ncbi:MAG: hypothetical protein RLZZ609_449 [Cyanobacteriota bacterium]|jgi:hypothetical protein